MAYDPYLEMVNSVSRRTELERLSYEDAKKTVQYVIAQLKRLRRRQQPGEYPPAGE